MKTIAVVCEKGGTGKSVIANELYESYVRQGVPASLYSLDGQYKDASSSKKVKDAEVAIVDTPGVLTDNLSDLVSGADVIVVNGTNRFRMCASFMAWLEKKPWAKNVVKVPQSEAIVQAQGMRKSVVNVDRHGAAAEAVRTMCRKVSVLAGLPFEKKQLKRIDTK